MHRRLKLILAVMLSYTGICSVGARSGKSSGTSGHTKSDSVISVRTGTASYYSPKFQGRHTSNGEVLDNEAYTCAAARVPYDSWVRVTNLRNNRSVVVRVTDRFRPGGSHLVDLTLRAAREIDMLRHGIARVRMEVLNPEFVRNFIPRDSITVPIPRPQSSLILPILKPEAVPSTQIR